MNLFWGATAPPPPPPPPWLRACIVYRYMHECIVTMHSAWNLIDDNLVEQNYCVN